MGDANFAGGRASAPSARAATRAWLAHPVSLAGIAVLLLNDHLLKAAFGTWWTGKLSDVAGLAFAPALVALAAALLAPRARAATLARGAVVGVGATFALVKATAFGAAAASAAWTAVTGPTLGTPSVVRHDATDLLALPALALAWWAFGQSRAAREPARRTRALRAAIVLPIAVFATAATSESDPPIVDRVIPIDGTAYVGFASEPGGVTWAVSRDGQLFDWVENGEVPDMAASAQGSADAPAEAWVPSKPRVGYRTTPGRIGVEKTTDGGATWTPEWTLSGEQRAASDARSWWSGDPTRALKSYDIAIVEDGDAYWVYVANGSDGFAVRAPDGVWRRASDRPALRNDGTIDAATEIAPPAVPITWTTAGSTPWIWAAAAWALAAFALAIPLARRLRPKALWAAIPLSLIGVGGLWGTSSAALVPVEPSWDLTSIATVGTWIASVALSVTAVFALVPLVAALVSSCSLKVLDWLLVAGWATFASLAALAVGLAAFRLTHAEVATALAAAIPALVLALAGCAFGIWRRAARKPPPPALESA